MDLGVGVLALVVGDMDALPVGVVHDLLERFLAPPLQGNEADSLGVERRELGIRREAGVKDERR